MCENSSDKAAGGDGRRLGPDDATRELMRRIRKTSKLRFIASDRLKRHKRASEWTTALLSVSLITVTLLDTMNVVLAAPDNLINVTQVSLAVLLLVFSLLISMENYGARAERMHTCGISLDHLARFLDGRPNGTITESDFERLSSEYSRVLDGHENHSPLDFERIKLDEHEWYYPKRKQYYFACFVYAVKWTMNFWPYAALIGIMCAAIALLGPGNFASPG